MAKLPNKKEIKKLLSQSQNKEKEKLASQKKQGKTFVNNGQGVIPEAVWKNLPGKTEVS